MTYFEKDRVGSLDYLRPLFPSFYKYEAIETSGELSPIEKKSISRDIRDNLRTDTDNGTRFGHRIGRIRRTFDMREDVLFGITFPSSITFLINVPKNLEMEIIPKNKYQVIFRGTPIALLLFDSFTKHETHHIQQTFSPALMGFWWEKFIQKIIKGKELKPPKQKIPPTAEAFPTRYQEILLTDKIFAYERIADEQVAEAASPQLGKIFLEEVMRSEPHREALISEYRFQRLVKENWYTAFTDFLFVFRGWDVWEVKRFIHKVRRNNGKYAQLKKSYKEWDVDLFLVDIAEIDVDEEFEKRINYLKWLENQFEYEPSRQRIQTIRRFMEEAIKEKTTVKKLGKLNKSLASASVFFVFHGGNLYTTNINPLGGFVWGWDQSLQLFVDIELALRLHKYPPSKMKEVLKNMKCPLTQSPQWRDTCGVGEEDPHITKWIQYLTDRT